MRKQRGFTLIELLVVITIIGILSAIGLASYKVANQKARDAKRKADIQAIQSALEVYRANNGIYPTPAQYNNTNSGNTSFNNSTYFSSGKKPDDPVGSGSYTYTYASTSPYYTYTLKFDLETDAGGIITYNNP